MDFNAAHINKHYTDLLALDVKQKIKSIKEKSTTFIFPFGLKTGFVNQTENGYKPKNATPSDYTQFSKSITGQEGLIAQWEGAVHISAPKVPSEIDYDVWHHERKSRGIVKIKSLYTLAISYIAEAYRTTIEKVKEGMKKPESDDDKFVLWRVMDLLLEDKILTSEISRLKYNNKEYVYLKFVKIKSDNKDGYEGHSNSFVDFDVFKDADTIYEEKDVILIRNDFWTTTIKSAKILVVDLNKIGTSLEYWMTKWYDKDSAKYFKGYLDTLNQSVDFGSGASSDITGDFTNWTETRKFSITTTEEVNKDFLFKLYMIPQHSNVGAKLNTDDNEIFYVENVESYFGPNGRQAWSTITFGSLNDALSSSGQTIDTKIMFGAPGEGYAIPRLLYNKEGKAYDFDINPRFTQDLGVSTIQVQNLGVAAINSIIVYGRPVEVPGTVNERIFPSRQLFLLDLKYPVQDALTQQSNPESTFYFGNFYPAITTYYSDWKEKRASQYTESIVKKFEGYIQVGADDAGGSRNLITQSNTNNSNLKDLEWTLNGTDNVGNKTNLPTDGFDMRANYKIAVSDKDGAILNQDMANSFNPLNHPKCRPVDLLNHNSIMFTIFTSLPIDVRQTTPWTLSNLPFIGGFLNKLLGGIPIGWRKTSTYGTSLTYPQFRGIPLLISAAMFNWYTSAFWGGDSANNGRVPFDAFKHSTSDTVGGIVDTSSQTTAICANITDKISASTQNVKTKNIENSINMSSVYLSTVLDYDKYNGVNSSAQGFWVETSTALDPLTTVAHYDVNPQPTNGKYIIDAIGEYAIGKTPVRITTFMNDPDDNEPFSNINWQATLKSRSMYTDNIRDIQTVFKVSYLDDFIEDGVTFNFPPQPALPGPTIQFKELDINANFNASMNKYYENSFEGYDASGDYFFFAKYNPEIPSFMVPEIEEVSERIKLQIYSGTESVVLFDFKSLGFKNFRDIIDVYDSVDLSGMSLGMNSGNAVSYNLIDVGHFDTFNVEENKGNWRNYILPKVWSWGGIDHNSFTTQQLVTEECIIRDTSIGFYENVKYPLKDYLVGKVTISLDQDNLLLKLNVKQNFVGVTVMNAIGLPLRSVATRNISVSGSIKVKLKAK